MQTSYQNTLVSVVLQAVTLSYRTDEGDDLALFNASLTTSQGADGSFSTTLSRIDGDGNVLKDASGDLTATGTGATKDEAMTAAMTVLAPRVVPPPVITSVSPPAGPVAGGTAITVFGRNLTGATEVTVGGAVATELTVVDSMHLTVVAPGGSAGQADIVVTGPFASATAAKAFTYQPPS